MINQQAYTIHKDLISIKDVVQEAFRGILRREPDQASDYYIREILEGRLTLAQLFQFFASLDEFFERCDPKNREHAIACLYTNFAGGRYGDPYGWHATEKSLVFFHFPKTAGVSILKSLSRRFHPIQLGYSRERLKRREDWGAWQRLFGWHMRWDEFSLIPAPKLAITCFREPMDRQVSLYRFLSQFPGSAVVAPQFRPAVNAAIAEGPERFFAATDPTVRNETDNIYVRYLANAFISQDGFDPLEENSDEAIETAFHRAMAFDGVFFFDELPRNEGRLPPRIAALLNDYFQCEDGWELPRENIGTGPRLALSPSELAIMTGRNCRYDNVLYGMLRTAILGEETASRMGCETQALDESGAEHPRSQRLATKRNAAEDGKAEAPEINADAENDAVQPPMAVAS